MPLCRHLQNKSWKKESINRNKRILIVLHWNNHLKGRNIYLKHLTGFKILHLISPFHFTHFRSEVAATHILVAFARLNYRLNSYNTFPFHFTMSAVAIKYLPVTTMKSYRKCVVIFKRNSICE